jgi:hypothetical protein
VALHILPDPAEFARQFAVSTGQRASIFQIEDFSNWGPFTVVGQIGKVYLASSPAELIVMLVVIGLSPRRFPERALLLLLLAVVVAFTALAPTLLNSYLIYYAPILALIFVGVLREWIARRQIVILVICLATAVPTLTTMLDSQRAQLNKILLADFQKIAATVAPDERIAAPQIFLFAMPDNPNLMAIYLPLYSRIVHADTDSLTVWENLAPTTFVVYGSEFDDAGERYRQAMGFAEVGRYPGSQYNVIIYQRRTAHK